jgi:hypothetical protein
MLGTFPDHPIAPIAQPDRGRNKSGLVGNCARERIHRNLDSHQHSATINNFSGFFHQSQGLQLTAPARHSIETFAHNTGNLFHSPGQFPNQFQNCLAVRISGGLIMTKGRIGFGVAVMPTIGNILIGNAGMQMFVMAQYISIV